MKFDCKKMHPKCQARCCGIVPIPKEIYERNKDKIQREADEILNTGDCFVPITEDHYCVFLNTSLNCSIYEDRPTVCQKFGDESHPMLCCPVLDKNGKERSRQDRRQIERQTQKSINKFKIIQ